MKIEKKYRLWFFVMFLAGSSVGFIIGAYTGGNFSMSLVLNNALQRDALGLTKTIDALRQLRKGGTESAIETIEASIDDTLVLFDPAEPYPGIRDETRAAIDTAIRRAYDYRSEFPRNSERPQVDSMVRSLFQKHNLTP